MYAGFDKELRLPCWYRIVRAHLEIFGMNVITARVFRLWYALFMSKERLEELRGKRARKFFDGSKTDTKSHTARTNVSTCSAYSNGKADAADRARVSSANLAGAPPCIICEFKARRWFVKRAYLGRPSFLWKFVVVATILDALLIDLVFGLARGDNRCGTGAIEIVETINIARICTCLVVVSCFS